jgi:signal transduction histidine kinase
MGAQDEPGNSSFTQDMDLLKAELLATVSHELRSPLASIKGYTATLLRHESRISREERHEFLVAIQEASNRLELIIDRLLELSQLETGGLQITCSALDVVPLVREAIFVAQQRVPDHASDRVTFQLHLKDTAGRLTHQQPLIKADRRRLREVLDHLLENAINCSPEGGAIDVILRPVLPGKVHEMRSESTTASLSAHMQRHMVEICVCDHGIGIPPEHLERIFERFHRVDTRLSRQTSGLGLGLTICKYLVELHDGLIWAESCPAGGSAFHLWLPVKEEETSLAALAETRIQ